MQLLWVVPSLHQKKCKQGKSEQVPMDVWGFLDGSVQRLLHPLSAICHRNLLGLMRDYYYGHNVAVYTSQL